MPICSICSIGGNWHAYSRTPMAVCLREWSTHTFDIDRHRNPCVPNPATDGMTMPYTRLHWAFSDLEQAYHIFCIGNFHHPHRQDPPIDGKRRHDNQKLTAHGLIGSAFRTSCIENSSYHYLF